MLYSEQPLIRYRTLCDHVLAKLFNLRLVTKLKMPLGFSVIADTDEEWVVSAVCEVTELTPDRWDKLSQSARVPWLERTLDELSKRLVAGAFVHLPGSSQESTRPPDDATPADERTPARGTQLPWQEDVLRHKKNGLRPMPYKLLEYMWGKDRAEYRALEQDLWSDRRNDGRSYSVFDDPEAFVNAVQIAMTRVNKFLRLMKYPRKLTKVPSEGILYWEHI